MELFVRDSVLEAFEQTEGRWLDRIRAVALAIHKRTRRPVSADDLRREMERRPELKPDRDNLNVMGAVFRGWTRVGFIRSETAGSHGNRIGEYVPGGNP